MKINRTNYESFLIDYFDGSLNANEVADVLLFLEQHADLKEEFEMMGSLPIESESNSIEFQFKQNLKKETGSQLLQNTSIDELMVADMEGDLTNYDATVFAKLIADSKSLQALQHTFLLTQLKPDLNQVYPHKKALKKSGAAIIYLFRTMAVAASIALLGGFMYLVYVNSGSQINSNSVAQTEVENTTVKQAIATPAPIKNQEKAIQVIKNAVTKNNAELALNENSKATVPQKELIELGSIASQDLQPITTAPQPELQLAKTNGLEKLIATNSMVAITDKNEFVSISQWFKNKLAQKGAAHLNESNIPNENKEQFDPLVIAAASADVLTKTTGKKVYFSRSFNKAGSLKSYAITAGNLKFERIKQN